ncbi:DUF1643 domain-containing protein [Salibacterium salarium]|nr:DUF1643 domain-containing protein [Salibacterium salarium]
MIKEVEASISKRTVMSEDHRYRYQLTKTWDSTKPCVAVVMLNPSKADMVKSDKTVISLTNYFVDHGYGELVIANLFSYMATDSSDLKHREADFEKQNDAYIVDACEKADIVLVGWGSDDNVHKRRKKEVHALLEPYRRKLKCFTDDKGRSPRHPRDIHPSWRFGNY